MNQYFDNNINLKSNIKTFKAIIKNQELTFDTDNGVFSKKGLDFGTRTLLEKLDLNMIKGDILDFGCGYGPIGIYLKKVNNLVNIDMIDVNERSLKLAKKNALLNDVNVNIFKSDIYTNVNKKYDFIISNPPIRVGKEILYKILFEAKEYLKENGQLWIVVNKNQGAKSVVKDLQKAYSVKIIDKNKGFYIICAINN